MTTKEDWNVASYEAFRDLRLRPGLDLLARTPPGPAETVVDLGCGAGALGAALRARNPEARLRGVDPSVSMLETARGRGVYDALQAGDAASFAASDAQADLIFANASLHWAADHETLMPALLGRLATGGALAVQMPRQFAEPSHALLRQTAAALFPERFAEDGPPPVAAPERYRSLLAPRAAALDLWETVYHQPLAPREDGRHPVAAFTASTAARPILERLDEAEKPRFAAAYDAALAKAYPAEADGRVWFPFRRLFFVAQV